MHRVRDALGSNQLFIAVQPIVDLEKKKVFAHEALLRSAAPGLKGPLDVLKAAIEENVIGELGRALRRMSVVTCPDTPLFLNLHPHEFDQSWLVRPDDAIYEHDQAVYLEITESAPITHFRWCTSVLREIRGRGVYLVVDDLGAGYSNLKYIADLHPEVVKVDRELVAGLDRQPRLQKLVRAIVRLCEDLGARVVAEGIETTDELRAVIDAGVHFGQGYLLARPANPKPAVNWAVFDALRAAG
jgi:EAL domain-containing protein (putative c-di-GMP-specific phosphodiesterase class I)